jgi:hypothetical protein
MIQNGSRYGLLLDDTQVVIESFHKWRVSHVRQEFNKAAHVLAKLATKHVIDRV